MNHVQAGEHNSQKSLISGHETAVRMAYVLWASYRPTCTYVTTTHSLLVVDRILTGTFKENATNGLHSSVKKLRKSVEPRPRIYKALGLPKLTNQWHIEIIPYLRNLLKQTKVKVPYQNVNWFHQNTGSENATPPTPRRRARTFRRRFYGYPSPYVSFGLKNLL